MLWDLKTPCDVCERKCPPVVHNRRRVSSSSLAVHRARLATASDSTISTRGSIEGVRARSVPSFIHFRSGDGLGCPSSDRKYRERNHRPTSDRGRRPEPHKESAPRAGRASPHGHGLAARNRHRDLTDAPEERGGVDSAVVGPGPCRRRRRSYRELKGGRATDRASGRSLRRQTTRTLVAGEPTNAIARARDSEAWLWPIAGRTRPGPESARCLRKADRHPTRGACAWPWERALPLRHSCRRALAVSVAEAL